MIIMAYFKDVFEVRSKEVLNNTMMVSKLSDANRIFANIITVRKDIMAIITRLNRLKSKVRSKTSTSADVQAIQRGILIPMKDELTKLFSIVEEDMLLVHDVIEYMHELLRIDQALARERAAQSSVKLKMPEIKTQEDAKKAQQKIDAAKKNIDKATAEGRRLVEMKTIAARSVEEIKIRAEEMRRKLKTFRNQFDAMRRAELKPILKAKFKPRFRRKAA